MKEIPLTSGKVAIVDDDMFEELSKYKWYSSHGYAARHSINSSGKDKYISMHRSICNTPDGMYTDHINGNIQDNRRENLRVCTKAGNQRNSKKPKNNTSGFKGVSFFRAAKKWMAYIRVNHRRIYLGYFDNPIDAARAYDRAAIELHGQFARTNF